MSFVRALVRPGEAAIRARQVSSRIFWQKSSPVPTYVRGGKGDVFFYGLTVSAITVGFVGAMLEANELIKGVSDVSRGFLEFPGLEN
ncbi:hypothetical protein HKX48_008328 [Thoreauomyces humboldtii]|nr:hypothetical protein HKX48_008328 [Thoreauomyces humboldtii]